MNENYKKESSICLKNPYVRFVANHHISYMANTREKINFAANTPKIYTTENCCFVINAVNGIMQINHANATKHLPPPQKKLKQYLIA